MSVRKAHNSGKNHLRNVVDYYQRTKPPPPRKPHNQLTRHRNRPRKGTVGHRLHHFILRRRRPSTREPNAAAEPARQCFPPAISLPRYDYQQTPRPYTNQLTIYQAALPHFPACLVQLLANSLMECPLLPAVVAACLLCLLSHLDLMDYLFLLPEACPSLHLPEVFLSPLQELLALLRISLVCRECLLQVKASHLDLLHRLVSPADLARLDRTGGRDYCRGKHGQAINDGIIDFTRDCIWELLGVTG